MAANKKAKRGHPTSERWLQKNEGKRVKKKSKKRQKRRAKREQENQRSKNGKE